MKSLVPTDESQMSSWHSSKLLAYNGGYLKNYELLNRDCTSVQSLDLLSLECRDCTYLILLTLSQLILQVISIKHQEGPGL